jgi:hypothetical protein
MAARKSDSLYAVHDRLRAIAQNIEVAGNDAVVHAVERHLYAEALDAIARLPRQRLDYGPRYALAAKRAVRAAHKKRDAELRKRGLL